MPFPDGSIKDCIRVYVTENGVELPIENDEYAFIDKHDITEINTKFVAEDESYIAQALVIRQVSKDPDEDPEIIGIIYPTTTEYKN